MTPDERRKLSADYTQLAKRLERGSPQNMRLLEKAIRINPSNDLAHYELSIPYLNSGLYEKWNVHISRAIELNPQAWQGWRGYYKLFYLRDYGGALVDLDATDTLTVNQTDYAQNMSVDYLRGLSYLGLNNLVKAQEYFNLYIENERESVGEKFINENAFLYLGIIENKKANYDEAIQYFERATQFEQGLADVYYHKAKALMHLKMPGEARAQLNIAREKYEEEKFLRGYMYEMPEQIYHSSLVILEKKISGKNEDL